MNLTPLLDRVVLTMIETEEVTKGGLILAGSAKEKPAVAEVVAVGPGGVVDGKEVVMSVKVGDHVLFDRFGMNAVNLDGTDYIITRQRDILAIVEDK